MKENYVQVSNCFYMDSVYAEGYEWYSLIHGNGLMKRNIVSNSYEKVLLFDEINIENNLTHSKILHVNGKIICIPFQSKVITMYDINNDEKIIISVPNAKSDAYSLFLYAVSHDEYVYFIPCRYDAVLRLNVNTHDIIEIFKIDDYEKFIWNKNNVFMYKGACIYNSNLIIAPVNTPFYVMIDLDNGEAKYCELPFKEGGTVAVYNIDKYLIFVGRSGEVCRFDILKNTFEIDRIENKNKYSFVFESSISINNAIVMLGSTSGKIYKYTPETRKTQSKRIIFEKNDKKFNELWHDFFGLHINEYNEIEFFSAWDGKKHILDDNLQVKRIQSKIKLTKEDRDNILKHDSKRGVLFEGNMGFMLDSFIENIE